MHLCFPMSCIMNKLFNKWIYFSGRKQTWLIFEKKVFSFETAYCMSIDDFFCSDIEACFSGRCGHEHHHKGVVRRDAGLFAGRAVRPIRRRGSFDAENLFSALHQRPVSKLRPGHEQQQLERPWGRRRCVCICSPLYIAGSAVGAFPMFLWVFPLVVFL